VYTIRDNLFDNSLPISNLNSENLNWTSRDLDVFETIKQTYGEQPMNYKPMFKFLRSGYSYYDVLFAAKYEGSNLFNDLMDENSE